MKASSIMTHHRSRFRPPASIVFESYATLCARSAPLSRSPLGLRALLAIGVLCWANLAYAQLFGSGEVPDTRVAPLPYSRASFEFLGKQLTCYHFGPALKRPFWYPLVTKEGYGVTRMGNPQAPQNERHHYSVWLAHQNVAGESFWEDGTSNRIAHVSMESFIDASNQASMTTRNHWLDGAGNVLMQDKRTTTMRPLSNSAWLMQIEVELAPPEGKPSVVLGKTAYGLLGVRVAKTMDLVHGRGRILDSEGRQNESAIFRKPARWVDFSGQVSKSATAGVALFDHPNNSTFPTPFHVRDVGFIMPSLTLEKAIEIPSKEPLKLRYGLWVHDHVPTREAIEEAWKSFSEQTVP